MPSADPQKQRRGLVAIGGAMALIVIVQMWLLSATLETYLAGRTSAVVPPAVFSGLRFSGCLALDLFVDRVDQRSRQR